MDCAKLNIPKVEINQNEFDWLYMDKPLQGILDQQLAFADDFDHFINSFLEFDQPDQTSNRNNDHHNNMTHFEFLNDFEEDDYISSTGDMNLWNVYSNIPSFYEDISMDTTNKLQNHVAVENFNQVLPPYVQGNFASSSEEVKRESTGKSKSASLEFDEIQKHFNVPITKAAKELNVGLTVLKKRCRELNIMRWPHRKIKSLDSLINNAKELGLTMEIKTLEEHRKMLEKLPELELTERTKKLRQACFKANYKKRRYLATLANV